MEIMQQINSWTLLEKIPSKVISKRTGKVGTVTRHGLFKCTCGEKVKVQLDSVKSGRSRMCVHCSQLNKLKELGHQPITKGTKFSKWTFIKYVKPPFTHTALAKCECGVKKEVKTQNLIKGKSRSCLNCAARKPFPLTKGDRFGRWTFLREAKPVQDGDGQFRKRGKFVCECGTLSTQRISLFLRGKTKSCKRCDKKQYPNSHTLLWKIFRDLMGKCYNPTDDMFHRYGAVNVGVFRKWRDDFMLFQDWAFTNGYKEGLAILRVKNYKNFTPANCEWTTKEEARISRSTIMVIFKDEVFTLYEVLISLGLYSKSKFDMCARRIRKGKDIQETLQEVFPTYRGQYFKK